jgi:hypothetical protein
MVAFDVDRNGLMDLAVANYGTRSASVFLNKGLKMATPSSASFGWVDMNATSAPKYFTIANSTGAPLSVASVITAGTDSAMFTVAPGGNTPCPGLSPTLAQGERCTVQGTFTPAAFGNRSASLVISSNHPVTPEFSIPLTGSVNPFILKINWTGTGSGSVNILPMPSTTYTSGPVNLSYYSDNQTVTLQATPGANASFGGWSGCDSVGGNLCAVTMNRSKTLSVNFQQIISCTSNYQCGSGSYCSKPDGSCGGTGTCVPWYPGGVCIQVVLPVCGCNGVTYSNSCFAANAGVSVAYNGECSINSCYASYQSATEHGAICWGTNSPSEILYANLPKTVVIGGGAVLKGIVVSNGAVEVNGATLQ